MPFEHLNSTPDPAELVTRYIFEKGHYSTLYSRANHKAWEPSRANVSSVSRIVNLSEAEIWDLGRLYVEPIRKAPMLARADISVQSVINLGLRVDPSEPPPRHAEIAGWPEAKDAKMSKAQQVAAEAAPLKLRP